MPPAVASGPAMQTSERAADRGAARREKRNHCDCSLQNGGTDDEVTRMSLMTQQIVGTAYCYLESIVNPDCRRSEFEK